MRELQKVIANVVDSVLTSSAGLSVDIVDIYNEDLASFAMEEVSPGVYEASWDEINSYGMFQVDGELKPEWGTFWLGALEQQKAVYLFNNIEMTEEEMSFVTGTSPLDVDSEGRTVGTFPAIPSIFITSKQGRQVLRNGEMTLEDGILTIPLCMSSLGDDGDGNYFDLALMINQPILT
jgi:hypothetical protein